MNHEKQLMPLDGKSHNRMVLVLAGAALALGMCLRLLAARDAFWLDEIWSYHLARSMKSFWDVFSIRHDNNHILNTLWMFLIGDCSHWIVYRAPALAAGLGAMVLTVILAREHGRAAAMAAAICSAFSYPLVVYSSEARGYALAMFFALAAFYFLKRYFKKHSAIFVVFFWTAVILGFLSHLTFAMVYLALLVWSLAGKGAGNQGLGARSARLAFCHAVPLAFVAWHWFFFMRRLTIGGADFCAPVKALARSAVLLAMGWPENGAWLIAGLAALPVLAGAGVFLLFRGRNDEWVFYACVLFASPALFLWARAGEYLHPRYFVICVPFFHILCGMVGQRLMDKGRSGACCFYLILFFFIAGNWERDLAQIIRGRGDYLAAMRYMAQSTAGPRIVAAGGDDVTNRMVLAYYARFLPPGKELFYCEQGRLPAQGPEWVLGEAHRLGTPAPPVLRDRKGNAYALARVFTQYGVSGWPIYVYRSTATIQDQPCGGCLEIRGQ